jgi:arylsulfatase A-like enzyme
MHKDYEGNEYMGYAIRTDQYRYVEWYEWNTEEEKKGEFLSNELFNHNIDPQENKNIAKKIEHEKTVELLSQQLKMGWRYAKPITQQTAKIQNN